MMSAAKAPLDPTRDPTADDPRRGVILMYARQAFLSEGYSAAKMEPLARQAQVSTATLYAQFNSKADLFAAVLEDAANDFTLQMAPVQAVEGSARDQLMAFALAYAEFLANPNVRAIFRLILAERPQFPEVTARFFDQGRHDVGAALVDALTALAGQNELRIDDPMAAAGQLLGMIEHPVFFVPLVLGDKAPSDRPAAEIAKDAVETFLARYQNR